MEIEIPPVDIQQYYSSLYESDGAFDVRELGRVTYAGSILPVLHFHWQGSSPRCDMLVIAGIHGNETAGLLAVPEILERLARRGAHHGGWEVEIVTPANPVGVAHASRYNGEGCDINRDFGPFRTLEARLIRDLIEKQRPDLIVSLHEGAQDGYFLIVTSKGSPSLGREVARAVEKGGVRLAARHFVGLRLGAPGLSVEGRLTSLLKRAIRLGSLGAYAETMGIGTYTAETNWASSDFRERIRAQVLTVEALLTQVSDCTAEEQT